MTVYVVIDRSTKIKTISIFSDKDTANRYVMWFLQKWDWPKSEIDNVIKEELLEIKNDDIHLTIEELKLDHLYLR